MYQGLDKSSNDFLSGKWNFFDNIESYQSYLTPALQDYIPFHADIYQISIMKSLLTDCDGFLELGTFYGGSSGYVAYKYPQLNIITCEPHTENFKKASQNLKDYKNVTLLSDTSVTFLDRKEVKSFKKPVIYVDSHDYFPKVYLLDEIQKICSHYSDGFMVINDFAIPNRPQFGYNIYESFSYNLDYVGDLLRKYGKEKVYGTSYEYITSSLHPLRGMLVVPLGKSNIPSLPQSDDGRDILTEIIL